MFSKQTRPTRKIYFLSMLIGLSFISTVFSEGKCQRRPGEMGERIVQKRKEFLKQKVQVAIITASDSKRAESGQIAAKLLKKADFEVVSTKVVKNLEVEASLRKALEDKNTDAVLLIGGTGFSISDVTPEAVKKFSEIEIPGFGELFRMITYHKFKDNKEEIGLPSLDTRATAAVSSEQYGRKLIVALPGSPEATELGIDRILILALPMWWAQIHGKD